MNGKALFRLSRSPAGRPIAAIDLLRKKANEINKPGIRALSLESTGVALSRQPQNDVAGALARTTKGPRLGPDLRAVLFR
jgi:hypothetical protein